MTKTLGDSKHFHYIKHHELLMILANMADQRNLWSLWGHARETTNNFENRTRKSIYTAFCVKRKCTSGYPESKKFSFCGNILANKQGKGMDIQMPGEGVVMCKELTELCGESRNCYHQCCCPAGNGLGKWKWTFWPPDLLEIQGTDKTLLKIKPGKCESKRLWMGCLVTSGWLLVLWTRGV